MAKKYLCVPGTSVPSERIFSKGGLIVDPFRCKLSPGHVNTLVFLSKTLNNSYIASYVCLNFKVTILHYVL